MGLIQRVVTTSTLTTLAIGLVAFGSCGAKNGSSDKTESIKFSVLYQGNVNGEIEPCG